MNLLPRFTLRLGLAKLPVFALIVLGFAAPTLAAIDASVTEQIWKMKFGVTEAQLGSGDNRRNGLTTDWMEEDADGDGIKNRAELAAGTNPFNASHTIAVTSVARNGTAAELQFPTEAGKLYKVETTTDLTNAGSWVLQAAQVVGDGGSKMLSVPYAANSFYRIRVEDFDSDNDGVSDWAEMAVSLNPYSITTSTGVNDYDYVQAQLATPNVVTIKATNPFASEDGPQAGMFTISRTQKLLPLTVNLNTSGTAVVGVDYTGLPGSVSFGAGAGSANLSVNPMQNDGLEGSESVTASLVAPSGPEPAYTLGANSSATVIINDSTVATGTGLFARYYDNSSSTYAHAANFGDLGNYAYTRGNPTTTGTIIITPTAGNISGLQVGHLVKLTFNGGNLNSSLYNHATYPVTALNNTTFTVSITGAAALPANSSSGCYYSIQSYPHPGTIERVDATVDNDWGYGTANGVTVTPNNPVDNYSGVWEGYLSPTTAGAYQFQLDADDKARVLLDLNDGNGLFEIVQHNWNSPGADPVGTFKQSAAYTLAVPTSAATRYKIRVEHVETTGDARCRLQWRLGTASFANIPQANVYTHQRTISSYAVASQVATINTSGSHGLSKGGPVGLNFSSGSLFTPPANYSGTYNVASVVDADTFTVSIPGAPNISNGGAGYLTDSTITTTGWLNKIYTNTTFTAPAGRVGVDNAGVTTNNNGIWISGTPDPALIGMDSFSVRWTGQVQPQFSEEYTFVVHSDDGCILWINGQPQELKTATSTITSGSTYSYDATSGDVVVNYAGAAALPGSFLLGEIVRLDPASGNLSHATGSTYIYDGNTGDTVVNYSNLTNVTPGSFAVGDTIELDPTDGTLSPLGTLPYIIKAATATTFTVNFGTGVYLSSTGAITVADLRNAEIKAVTATSFTVNFGAGRYATGTGNMNVELLNKTLKDWSSMGNERFVRIPMIGGVRYDIRLDYFESSGYSRCRLFWYSPSQPRQIIPSNRLYPSSGTLAPPVQLSSTDKTALVGGLFSHTISGTNGATVTVSGNPAWLSYSGGVLSGTPPPGSGGDYQILITITNAAGTSTSVVNVHVEDTGGMVVREIWSNFGGSGVGDIPVGTPPNITENLSSLEATTGFGVSYGARIRGYLTAPATGNYYFWIAGSDAAELWISNDDEPVNAFKRAWATGGSGVPQWNLAAPQKSPWMALEEGHRYYFEILQKAGASDHLAIGWLKPGETGTTPGEIVPGFLLSPYLEPAPGSIPGTLYVSTMLSQNGASTKGVGSSTLRLSDDESVAYMTYSYSGLTGPITSQHIHTDPYLSKPSTIVFDIDTPETNGDGLQPDGRYKWTITPIGTLTKADIVEIIKQGKAYINLHTAIYPAGEIRGNYTLANGSRTFSEPPPPPDWTDDHNTDAGAIRFLTQATFGANIADIAALKAMPSYEAWIDAQFAKEPSLQLPEVLFRETGDRNQPFDETLTFNSWWRNSVAGPDQLRQRVAFALSEIHVVSAIGPLDNNARALSFFYDMLASKAFGNFREILEATTLAPGMGRYLDMLRNDKPDLSVGRIPNENYAREIEQLFSIGLFRMWPDGTLMLNSRDEPIDTYSQREIIGFAHAFTGWDYGYDGPSRASFGAITDWTRPMRVVPARHYIGPKRILNNEVLPGLERIGNKALDPYAVPTSGEYYDPAYEALPAQELAAAHDQLFNHSNVGPFICRQLIQRLVTSNPSRDYLYRIVQKFNDNGSGVRGDMKVVVKAILLDYEARDPGMVTKPAFGKQREPLLRVTAAARAFRKDGFSGTYSQSGTRTITVNTTTAHKLNTSNNVYLEFPTGSPAPSTGIYSVASISGAQTTSTQFTVNATGWIVGTYSQSSSSNTLTVTLSNHWLAAGHQVFLDFIDGGANGVANLDATVHPVVSSSGEAGTNATFTINAPNKATRSGSVMLVRFTGSFFIANSGLPAPQNQRITLNTTNGDHHLAVDNQVFLNFSRGNPMPADAVFTVESVPDRNTFTVLTTGQTNQSENGMYMFPLLTQPLTRSGNIAALESTYNLGSTGGDISQSPLNSPTVFNFFLPDYKFPGALASQGITTPEFQETSDTNVVRQANFLYNGIFNPGNTNGISSFKSGTNALIMDLSPWMGNAVDLGLGAGDNTSQAWTSNENIDRLIERLNMLLTAGQLSTAACTRIQDFVTNTAYVSYTNSSPSDPQKRDRLRAVLHLILTSPDFTIQR